MRAARDGAAATVIAVLAVALAAAGLHGSGVRAGQPPLPLGNAEQTTPTIEVWFVEGCGGSFALGTELHLRYRANVADTARIWRQPDGELFIQTAMSAGVTYEIVGPVTGPPGQWWIIGELLDTGATATCHYTTTAAVATPTHTSTTGAPSPTATPTPTLVAPAVPSLTRVATGTATPSPSRTATAPPTAAATTAPPDPTATPARTATSTPSSTTAASPSTPPAAHVTSSPTISPPPATVTAAPGASTTPTGSGPATRPIHLPLAIQRQARLLY